MDAKLAPGGSCLGKDCWKALNGKGFSYKNKNGNASGITAAQFKVGSGKAKISIKGKGTFAHTTLPTLPLTDATAITVQVIKNTSAGAECWGAALPPPAKRNDGVKFSDALP